MVYSESNRQNTRSFGKFLAGNPTRPPAPVSCADIVRLRSPPIPFPDLKQVETYRSVLFEIEIPCILLFLNRYKNSQNSPKEGTLGCSLVFINFASHI